LVRLLLEPNNKVLLLEDLYLYYHLLDHLLDHLLCIRRHHPPGFLHITIMPIMHGQHIGTHNNNSNIHSNIHINNSNIHNTMVDLLLHYHHLQVITCGMLRLTPPHIKLTLLPRRRLLLLLLQKELKDQIMEVVPRKGQYQEHQHRE
jgi:hypothetical protein